MGSEGGVGGVRGRKECAGGGGQRGGEGCRVEARAEGQEGAEDGRTGRSSRERLGEGVADGRLGKVGGEGADFLVAERSRQLGGEARESDGGVFAAEGEGGEDPVFEGKRAAFG